MAEISIEDYNLISHVVKGYSGLDLGPDKRYLLESRLTPLLSKFKMTTLAELFAALRKNERNPFYIKAISEALATHESLFFRDVVPFDFMIKTIFPNLMKANPPEKKIRIWSAACSIGQEPYSIAFALHEARATLGQPNYEIIATDFSSFAIERAKRGIYSNFEAQRGLTQTQIHTFFNNVPSTGEVQVKDIFKSRITFKELNFLDSFISLGSFDIIFCRNVLIYFTNEMKKQILEKMAFALQPNGYLVLGNTESTHGITNLFDRAERSNCSIYSKNIKAISDSYQRVV